MKKRDKARILVLGGGIAKQLDTAGGRQIYASYTDKDAIRMVDSANAVVLTGGVDINPRIYGQKTGSTTQHANDARDNVEVRVLQAAFKRGIPILGICRGSQMINAAFGGTLHQELRNLPQAHKYHLGHDHRVGLEQGSRVRTAFGTDEAWVTSIHHQAVDKVAPGFCVNARSKDGLVEGVEIVDPERWIVGVQFHPEIDTDQILQGLFNALVAEAARVAGLPTPETRPVKPHHVINTTGWKPIKKISNPITKDEVDQKRAQMELRDGKIVAWQCFRCGIRFDERLDHLDHMWFIHNVDLLDGIEDREINAILYDGKE